MDKELIPDPVDMTAYDHCVLCGADPMPYGRGLMVTEDGEELPICEECTEHYARKHLESGQATEEEKKMLMYWLNGGPLEGEDTFAAIPT